MNILDCEYIDSTYESIQKIFKVPRSFLTAFFQNLDINGHYEKTSESRMVEDYILGQLEKEINIWASCDAIYWFHFTRTQENNKFEQGILPLGEVVEPIWDFLYSLIKDRFPINKWDEIKQNIKIDLTNENSKLYFDKVHADLDWGPFGMLIKDAGLATWKNRDNYYLNAPEIVEDICWYFEDKTKIDLLSLYKKNTSPCIIKFINYESRRSAIGIALYYLWQNYHEQELSINNNTCYDGYGKPIERERIVKIEFI